MGGRNNAQVRSSLFYIIFSLPSFFFLLSFFFPSSFFLPPSPISISLLVPFSARLSLFLTSSHGLFLSHTHCVPCRCVLVARGELQRAHDILGEFCNALQPGLDHQVHAMQSVLASDAIAAFPAYAKVLGLRKFDPEGDGFCKPRALNYIAPWKSVGTVCGITLATYCC